MEDDAENFVANEMAVDLVTMSDEQEKQVAKRSRNKEVRNEEVISVGDASITV